MRVARRHRGKIILQNYNPIEDVYVWDRQPNDNLNNDNLVIKRSIPSYNRIAYLHFELGNFVGTALELIASSVYTPTTLVVALVNPFNITDITWNNKDSLITSRQDLASTTITGLVAGGDVISLSLGGGITGSAYIEIRETSFNHNNFFYSKEFKAGAYSPVIK